MNAGLYCTLFALAAGPLAGGGPERPNVVVIMADDMGFSDAGCYGGEIETPHLDALAAEGLRFSRFYNTGRCCPTRASLLSGHYPHAAGMGWMISDRGAPGYAGSLRKDRPTLAELVKPAGYRAYMTGKWHVSPHTGAQGPKDNWPLARGFDRFYGSTTGSGDYWDPVTLVRGDEAISAFDDPLRPAEWKPDGSGYHYTDATADEAVRFVGEHAQQHADAPFLLYVAFTAPHWPLHAPQDLIERYNGLYDGGFNAVRKPRRNRQRESGLLPEDIGLAPVPKPWSQVPQDQREWEAACMATHAAMVTQMDAGIGRLLAELDRTGAAENTVVMFLSDNGGSAEDQGRFGPFTPRQDEPTGQPTPPEAPRSKRTQLTRDGFPLRRGVNVMPGPPDTFVAYGESWANVSNTPFRLYKSHVHEGGISTPLIVRWPAGMREELRGGFVRDRAHVVDLAPTVLELAGAEYPAAFGGGETKPLPGRSLGPDLRGEMQIALLDARPLFWEHEGNRAVSQPDGEGDWKLVAGAGKPWELYDLSVDRIEANDLSKQRPEKVAELSALWDEWAAGNDVLPLGGWQGKPQRKRTR
ncbi:arylsulfatase [Alienimonas californiensis]|uniref:Arylsulfatase n=1 Tax=Alienimonas californiensis TaxID=2527989 RepID=A0A517PCF0_9PLAN|nr:arylsulfatase [Alienimonas californiensis]QDT17021.1 Arylsulfatase [Alienimonas californiensis]